VAMKKGVWGGGGVFLGGEKKIWTHPLRQRHKPMDQLAPRRAQWVSTGCAPACDAGDRRPAARWRADDPLLTSRGRLSPSRCGWCSAASWIFPPAPSSLTRTVAPTLGPNGPACRNASQRRRLFSRGGVPGGSKACEPASLMGPWPCAVATGCSGNAGPSLAARRRGPGMAVAAAWVPLSWPRGCWAASRRRTPWETWP